MAPPLKVMHFVTGGFSGATQVALDLCLAAQGDPGLQTLLVLRRKRNTSAARVQALRAQGLQVQVVSNWMHWLTVWELGRISYPWLMPPFSDDGPNGSVEPIAPRAGLGSRRGLHQMLPHPRPQLAGGVAAEGDHQQPIDGGLAVAEQPHGQCRHGVGLAGAGGRLEHHRAGRQGCRGVELDGCRGHAGTPSCWVSGCQIRRAAARARRVSPGWSRSSAPTGTFHTSASSG